MLNEEEQKTVWLRQNCLDLASRSNPTTVDDLIAAARKIEAYLTEKEETK